MIMKLFYRDKEGSLEQIKLKIFEEEDKFECYYKNANLGEKLTGIYCLDRLQFKIENLIKEGYIEYGKN